MTEKTQTASQEQLRELTSALVQGVPTDLSEETVLKCIQDKKKLHRWLRLGLTHGLTEIDFRLVKAFLEGTLELRFDQSARQRLEEDGWQIVRIPAGITLSSLANRIPVRIVKFPPSREYKEIPTRSQEIAWYPSEPIWPITRSKKLSEAKELVYNRLQKEVQFRYRNGVKVVFPTLELVAWLVCYHLKEESPERPYVDITWADNGVMREYVFSLRKRPLFLITPVSGDIFESDLGVLRLIEPSF